MLGGLFEALGSAWEKVGGFFSGVFGRAAEEEITWPTVSEALAEEGLPELPFELEADFYLHEQQQAIAGEIAGLPAGRLIPGYLHLETERLLPTKYAYEVEMTWVDEEGNVTTKPYYVGSDVRLTSEEVLEVAEDEGEQSPEAGGVAYSVGGISAAWVTTGEPW